MVLEIEIEEVGKLSSVCKSRPLPVPAVPTSVQGHYHTGTSSNRRRLMYAQFVSVFEFRIQMAHLPKSRWLSGWLKGNDAREKDAIANRMVRTSNGHPLQPLHLAPALRV
ncbi:hypothetical protein M0804_001862 [Polistes exclamans]|nr:hypothetical protein M0804_001862 [Polistes exclamans]